MTVVILGYKGFINIFHLYERGQCELEQIHNKEG